MTATNQWAIGAMFYGGLVNGQPFFVQPGGIGTPVYPTQKNAQPWPEYPIPGLFINEFIPIWTPGCGHSTNFWLVIREYDYVSQNSVALICCSVCTFVENVYSPFEEWLEPITHAIVIA